MICIALFAIGIKNFFANNQLYDLEMKIEKIIAITLNFK